LKFIKILANMTATMQGCKLLCGFLLKA